MAPHLDIIVWLRMVALRAGARNKGSFFITTSLYMPTENKKESDTTPLEPQLLSMMSFMGEVGLIVSLPLVLFVPLAVKLDKAFGTVPLFIGVSLVGSLLISVMLLKRKLKSIL